METKDFLSKFESLNIPIIGVRLPSFEIEDKYKKALKLPEGASNFDFLRALCVKGFNELKLKKGTKEYEEYGSRVKKELDILQELGFVDYMLLVWDVINFCKENSIPTGLGRGSAAGSLVLFLIGVTKVDPIKHSLYFERFVSKTRAKKQVVDGITYLDGSLMCDVDMDICYYNRHKVLKYLEEKFKGRTCKILTFNTLSAKLCIKEVGKIAGDKSEEEMNMVSAMIPKLHGQVQDLNETYEGVENKPEDQEKKGKWKIAPTQEFVEWCDSNRQVYEIAKKIKDLNKNKGVHPSGIIITHDELDDCCPIELSSDKDLVSSYDMDWVALFTVKLDALGLRGVSVVDDVCKQLGIKMTDIDLNDPCIYQNLQDLKYPHGLFQIEADLGYRTTQKVKPRNLGELSAVLALARPGAMQFIDQFASFTNTDTYECIHPFFDSILKETGGVCIYQEQMMQMAHKIGFTLDEAEILRRIVGKKKVEEVKEWQQKIKDKVKENKLDPKIADVLWKILEDSASYSFNKSHSVAYASLAATTIYLKFKYPTQFYLSLLRMTKHEPDPIGEISKIHKEMQAFGIELLRPSLTHSQMDFSIEGKNIRFGLSSIKGISEKTIEKLNNFKRQHANKFQLFESAKEAGLTIGHLSALIQAGTIDNFGRHRALMVYEAQVWNKLKDKEKKASIDCGKEFDYQLPKIVKALNSTKKDEKGKPIIKDSRLETIKKHTDKYKQIYLQNNICEAFANWWYEKRLLGYVTSTKLIDIFREKRPSLEPISTVMESGKGGRFDFIGHIEERSNITVSKNKSKYLKYIISDESGTLKVMIFGKGANSRGDQPDKLENCKALNNGFPKEEDIVIVSGTHQGDGTVFADFIAVQQNVIYTKLSELKDSQDPKESEQPDLKASPQVPSLPT